MNVDHKVREQLTLSRHLLDEPDPRDSSASRPLCLLRDLIVAHGATELALAAICVQLDCVPDKKVPCLPDYFDSLTAAVHTASTVRGMGFIAELHKVQFDSQRRFRAPDPARWTRAKAETLEHITGWCQQFLGLSLLDCDSVLTASLSAPTAAAKPVRAPEQPVSRTEHAKLRYHCAGSADIRLAHMGQSEKGRIENLSVGGCFVKSELLPGIGDCVEMFLHVNKMSFRVSGNVVHIPSLDANSTEGETGMGVQFKEMSAGARGRLQELLEDLKMNMMVRRAPG
jgi:Tfp pilus assembly protein PilZ